jgi:archaemetzincin
MKLLQLLPIGDFDGRLLIQLAPAMANLFRVPTEVLQVRLDPEFAYHPERQQYHSSEILQAMQRYVGPDSWRVLGVTGVDLYIPFGFFFSGTIDGCVVWFPLPARTGFYGPPPDRGIGAAPAEAVHELDTSHDTAMFICARCFPCSEWMTWSSDGRLPRMLAVESATVLSFITSAEFSARMLMDRLL